jgi:hypothetical protein
MSFKPGDRLIYIGPNKSHLFNMEGEKCTVNRVMLSGRVRVKFDHPNSLGYYRLQPQNFKKVYMFLKKSIPVHNLTNPQKKPAENFL